MAIKIVAEANGDKAIELKLTLLISRDELFYRIYKQMQIYGEPLPVSRQECMDYIVESIKQGREYGWDLDEELPELEERLDHLFPELKE